MMMQLYWQLFQLDENDPSSVPYVSGILDGRKRENSVASREIKYCGSLAEEKDDDDDDGADVPTRDMMLRHVMLGVQMILRAEDDDDDAKVSRIVCVDNFIRNEYNMT